MKKQIILYIYTVILCLSSINGTETTQETDSFDLGKGINVCHWLAEHFDFIPSKDVYFTKEDVLFLKESGFQHIRIPIEEIEMWNDDGSPNEESFEYLDKALTWAYDAGLKVVIDLHIFKGHHFNVGIKENFPENTLFTSEETLQHLIDLWLQISDRYSEWPNNFLAYEILNEPIAEDAEDWNYVVEKWMEAMRQKEPNRFIVSDQTCGNRHSISHN
jgi:endoglucanase